MLLSWRKPLLFLMATVLVLAPVAGPSLQAAFSGMSLAASESEPNAAEPEPKSESDAETDAQRAYIWSATRDESRIKLRGLVPSEDDRRTVLGMVKAHFPDLQVEDRLKVAAGAPAKEQWLGAMSFGLKQLSHMKRGAARLANVGLKLDGEARSANDYAEIKKALSGPLPTGLSILAEDVRPPLADPFVFVADLTTNALKLTGSVPSESARKDVRELARQMFTRPGLDDKLQLASGAPKGWDNAVSAALRALSRLESGKVSLSGLAVTIEGMAPDEKTAAYISSQLKRDLPALFSSSESIRWKTAATESDVIERIIPRIKALAQTDSERSRLSLPPLDSE
jgi:hypothetical protein